MWASFFHLSFMHLYLERILSSLGEDEVLTLFSHYYPIGEVAK